jgi:hypothetical protein
MSIFGSKYPLIKRPGQVAIDARYSRVVKDEPETAAVINKAEIGGARYSFVRGQRWIFEIEINLFKYPDSGDLVFQRWIENLGATDFIIFRHYDGEPFTDENGIEVFFTLVEVKPFYLTQGRKYDRLLLRFVSNDFVYMENAGFSRRYAPYYLRTINFSALGLTGNPRGIFTSRSGRFLLVITDAESRFFPIINETVTTQFPAIPAQGSGAYAGAILERQSEGKYINFIITSHQYGTEAFRVDLEEGTQVKQFEITDPYHEKSAFDPVYNILHVAVREQGLRAYRVDYSDDEFRELEQILNMAGVIREVAVSPDGEYIVACSLKAGEEKMFIRGWNTRENIYSYDVEVVGNFTQPIFLEDRYFMVIDLDTKEVVIFQIGYQAATTEITRIGNDGLVIGSLGYIGNMILVGSKGDEGTDIPIRAHYYLGGGRYIYGDYYEAHSGYQYTGRNFAKGQKYIYSVMDYFADPDKYRVFLRVPKYKNNV